MDQLKTMLFVSFLLVATGCNFSRAQTPPTIAPTPTTLRVVQVSPVATVARQLQPIDGVTPAPPTPTQPIVETEVPTQETEATTEGCITDLTQLTQHVVTADVNYREQLVRVEQRINYINRSEIELPVVVFNVEPNRNPGVFELDSIMLADGSEVAAYELTGRGLKIDLVEPLKPDCAVEITLSFRLQIPPVGQGLAGLNGYFGFSRRQINLGHWLPTAAPRIDGEWITRDVAAVGEQVVADVADWDVIITVTEAEPNLQVVGPGAMSEPQSNTWHFQHANSREFTVSMSDQFNRITEQTENGVMVEVYTFADSAYRDENGNVIDGAAHALTMAVQSLELFSDLFGAYPNERFIVVQGDFPDGMEFSELVFVSTDWFRTYRGDPTSYLTIITVHEVAHQWWYAQVGSDQAVTPWLDESLATYSEYLFYEQTFPELRDWWWQFRVDAFIPWNFDGNGTAVDSTVYQFDSVRGYINAVYLRGARMLRDLREDVGGQAFFDLLKAYAATGAGEVVSADVFWSLLSPEQLDLTRETRMTYLGTAEIAAELTPELIE